MHGKASWSAHMRAAARRARRAAGAMPGFGGRNSRAPSRAVAPPIDAVSGLGLRAAFDAALDLAARQCDGTDGSLVVLYVDLDNLRLINDAYGHAVGDLVLGAVARLLKAAVPAMIAATRVAGDEFLVALYGDRAAGQVAAQRLQADLKRGISVVGRELSLSASIGIARYPHHGARSRLPLQAAAAMRSVKHVGGGAHAEFEPAMSVDLRQEAELLLDLRKALGHGALQLVYQPKIDARSLQVTAAEALLRWQDSRRGLVSPSLFVPLAERHGLMVEIGRWVIEEACRQAGAWRGQGLRMRVAVNISGHQLRHDGWVEHLCENLSRHKVQPSRFTCEITESVAMENTQVTRQAFERLRSAGVHVSIDDFGTGHSSLAMLLKLPAAELKIDRAFVTDLEASADARSIAEAIIRLGHQLAMRVVAEGVETEAQRDCLVAMGCDELQGFLFARPMSPTALGIWAGEEPGPRSLAFRASLFYESDFKKSQS
ncbi:MAG: bifunctional diguanylate cyclase/phosphodiesterase [Rubrivivax sp.]